ncbi:MAG: ATP-binding cassette domain-containing protein [Chloroflexi bacterium]|nr:ATP-binding cassette domain-containing protein [Chloroflexota bacterium]
MTAAPPPAEPLDAQGLRLTAIALRKEPRPGLNLLQDISLAFQPNEFIVIVGQSGGGKSTLLDALSGYRPASSGQVLVNEVDAYQNFDAIRTLIGYVPQRDIIHMELTVRQALDYAAQLRLPRGTRRAARRQRVEEVLQDLDLAHRADAPVASLSGGQQKRVSIGVELLTRPRLFFLDEPTSGLDPATETALMLLMRKLADQGRTILLVTHATKNVMLADKAVFLARGGHLAWFGPPQEALQTFDPYRSEAERRARPIEFDDIYAILEDSSKGSPQEWGERYRGSTAYQKYIQEPLRQAAESGAAKVTLRDKLEQARQNYCTQIRPVHQFFVLSARHLTILARDRASLILMLLAPLLVGSLDFLLAPMMGRDIYDFYQGAPVSATQSLFLLTLYALMVAGLSQMREIVKESAIYRRERLVNLRILPYVASKVWVAALLAAYQALAYTLIRYQAFHMPGGWADFDMVYLTVFLATLSGMMLGLLASALSPNTASAPMLVILLIIPTIVLSGALVNVPPAFSAVSSSHWAFKALVEITGVGADVAADACWQFPDELIQAMSIDDKQALGCRCMGVQMFDPAACNFPGVGKYAVPELTQSPPQKPPDLGAAPGEPVLPPPPAGPSDTYDKVAVAAYLSAVQTYQDEATRIQEEFQRQMADYKSLSAVYQAQMGVYQQQLSRWHVARSAAVGAAEGNIRAVHERFAWAFVSQDDPAVFRSALQAAWQAQAWISAVLILLTLALMKQKDVKK